MGDHNILPKGGFFRGVLAGLTLIALIFIGLANVFPLMDGTSPQPATITELSAVPVEPTSTVEESSTDIPPSTEAPEPSQIVTTLEPEPVEDTAPVVLSTEPQTAAPVSAVAQADDTASSDIQIGSSITASPTMSSPAAPVIEAPVVASSLTSQESIDVPSVSSEIAQASSENDTSTSVQITEQAAEPMIVEEPKVVVEPVAEPEILEIESVVSDEPEVTDASNGGLELTGQTLIVSSDPVEENTPVEAGPVTINAFSDYSAPFADDGPKSLLSFILLAETVEESNIISSFSTPITLAVAAENPNANAIIANYRATGGEVVLLLPSEGDSALRKGGNASDVPQLLGTALSNSDGVMGIMDGPAGDINQDTRMISAIVAQLSQTGHAIMTINGLGLNRTSILAKEAGVPAADISQYIEIDNGTIAVVRSLDKLVLQIGNQKSVTVYAESNPDMLFALKFWLDSEKSKAVTVAPVSAAILRH